MVGAAAEMLSKRGPDDSGVWTEGGVGLGHRRLAILDVTQAGHQPMVSPDGRHVIVFNGEIYNFLELRRELAGTVDTWSSSSDTEVVLAAYAKWGHDCVSRFHGMFAFAIWDRWEKVLFAARDRMGVKPFYYHGSAAYFSFASRPRALFGLANLRRDIDEEALRLYLESGYVPAPYAIQKAVRKLPPAHYMLVDQKGVRLERYWDFRSIKPETSWNDRPEEELLDELDQLVCRSVQSRLISDVPLGAFLSGGIDSSLVAGLMTRVLSHRVKTFTIGFYEKDYDESRHAQNVAEYLGTDHHCETLRVDDLVGLCPIFKKSLMSLFSTVRHSLSWPYPGWPQACHVSLSGDGGDEMFGETTTTDSGKLRHFFRLPGLSVPASPRWWNLAQHRFRLLSRPLREPDASSAFAFPEA